MAAVRADDQKPYSNGIFCNLMEMMAELCKAGSSSFTTPYEVFAQLEDASQHATVASVSHRLETLQHFPPCRLAFVSSGSWVSFYNLSGLPE
jgi:hypothetical protein